jgi:thioredoxin reductase (NADPH)
MTGSSTVWLVSMAVVAAVFIPYWVSFRRRLKVDRERHLEARQLGIDKPVAQFPFVDALSCIGCGACVDVCPEGDVLGIVGGTAVVINGLRCVGHGHCEVACPVEAIEVGIGDLRSRKDVPLVDSDLQTTVPGIFVAGELGGLSLVRNAASQGRAAVERIAERVAERGSLVDASALDLVIVGAGPAGLSAALTARTRGLSYLVLEKEATLGGSLLHYPRRKMVLTQPLELSPWGSLDREEYQKEELLEIFSGMVEDFQLQLNFGEELESAMLRDGLLHIATSERELIASNLLLAVGRRGSPRKLGVPGEDQAKVMYRLMDAQAYRNSHILIVGGGDSAAEAAIGLARQSTNRVTLSYRKDRLVRLKKKNLETIEKLIANGRIQTLFGSEVTRIDADFVELRNSDGTDVRLENNYVFVFAGGVPPYPLLREMGIQFGGQSSSSVQSLRGS